MPRFLSLAEAVEETIRNGDTVAMEGFTHLIPNAAGHEVIRQRRQHRGRRGGAAMRDLPRLIGVDLPKVNPRIKRARV
jgi:hypothetical protein